MLRQAVIAFSLCLPAVAFAKDDDSPPAQTKTTQDCFQVRQWDPSIKKWVKFSKPVNGVWDANIRKCVRPDKTSYLDEDTLYGAVRELAYAGRYNDAITVLDQMPDQNSDRVMTYRGFTARKLGDLALADVYYQKAINLNPDNIAARSYMGQGLVAKGDKVAAMEQLREIRARGGVGSWSEKSLAAALKNGRTFNY
ncbi:MAG: hypothetical protein ABJM43_01930 [Paracoccaceae bacterium]